MPEQIESGYVKLLNAMHEIDTKVDRLNGKFDQLATRVNEVELRHRAFDDLRERMSKSEYRLEQIESRAKSLLPSLGTFVTIVVALISGIVWMMTHYGQ